MLALLCVCCSGCINPMFTRLPSYWTYHPTSEARAYEQQDPFPDPDIGPEVSSRPRGYDRPRTVKRPNSDCCTVPPTLLSTSRRVIRRAVFLGQVPCIKSWTRSVITRGTMS